MAHFVPLDRVFKVCDSVMFKLSHDETEEFKALLRSKGKDRGSVPHVESSLALRLMLEYYKREKK